MTVADVAGTAVAVVVVLGFFGAVILWFYRRGGQEQAFTDALERNTAANEKLTTKLDDFKAVVVEMFHEMDKRVTKLEERVKTGA